MDLADFDYPLEPGRIAQQPIEPRDAARLLHTPDMTDHRFADLPKLLRPDDVVVLNSTRVRRARLRAVRANTGGTVEVLLLDRVTDTEWEALLRPARRIRKGAELSVEGTTLVVVGDPVEGRVRLSSDGDVEALAAAHGSVPLPPYITSNLADPDDYQTVYAEVAGSAAAPTAGLHFSHRLMEELMDRAIAIVKVDLHVGLGTFRPIATERVEDHVMHAERFRIDTDAAEYINEAAVVGRRIVAVGTTVVRALESAVVEGTVVPGERSTSLFIRPGFEFQVVDALITNFHLPRSSLIVMVAAFMGDRWRLAYETALEREYRFLSFGDAMMAARS